MRNENGFNKLRAEWIRSARLTKTRDRPRPKNTILLAQTKLVPTEVDFKVPDQPIRGAKAAAEVFRDFIGLEAQEHTVAAYLSPPGDVLGFGIVSKGSLTECMSAPREVFGPAIRLNCEAIILAHNHPSGTCKPSIQDRKVFKRLKAVGELVGIKVLDSLVITHDEVFSISLDDFVTTD